MSDKGSVAPKERVNIVYKSHTGEKTEEVELPLKLLVLGNFSGRQSDEIVEERKTININKENFDEVMKSYGINIDLSVPNTLDVEDVFGAVKRVYDQIEGMGPLLQDPRRSSIRIVLNPERMVINESQRLYTYLSLFGFPVDAVVANRVLPEEARSAYFDRWFSIQAGHLATARADFDPLPFFEAPLFDREMVGTEMLDEFGRRVFGKSDPSAVLHREKPVEVKKEGRAYALYLRLPFAEKDRIQVFARGDELVVQVDNQRRTIVLPRTLAGRAVASAGFAEQRLRVAFGSKEAS